MAKAFASTRQGREEFQYAETEI